jgi:hypothetical protein
MCNFNVYFRILRFFRCCSKITSLHFLNALNVAYSEVSSALRHPVSSCVKLIAMTTSFDEVQRQLDRIVALGYPDVADLSESAFRALAQPLIQALKQVDLGTDILLIPTRELVTPESLIARTSIGRMAGFTTMPPRDIASFIPQDGFEPPEGPFYLVLEPHTGTRYTNREPDVARKLIDSDDCLPLTLEEGLAIATQHPDWLAQKNGFNLLGSRSADGRVPSIWMSQNAPRLGSVWPNSRHTWLGNAFCQGRRGVSLFG